MRRAAALAAVWIVGACSRDPAPRPPIDNRGGAVAVDAGADAPDRAACVAACERERQMVAMSVEAIRAECERSCAAAPAP